MVVSTMTNSQPNSHRPKSASLIKIRFQVVLLTVLCPIVCYISRQNLSLAIVSIVNAPTETTQSDSQQHSQPNELSFNVTSNELHYGQSVTAGAGSVSLDDVCPAPETLDESGKQVVAPKVVTYGPRYNWDPFEQNLVFQTFFFTYVIFQIPATRFAETYGAKWIMFAAGAGSSVISLLSPWAIGIHPYAYSVLRALMGVFQAALYPSCYVIIAKWLPPIERSQVIPLLSCAAYVGSMFTSTATGYFSEQPSFGWPWAFYMPGIVCGIWSLLWALLSASEPADHKSISLEELEYIQSKIGVKSNSQETKKSISWPKVFRSRGVWAFIIVSFASNWAYIIVLLQLPTYLNDILGVPPFRNGIINSVIYFIFCVASPVVGSVSTLMIETKTFGLTKLQVRRFFQSVAMFGQAAAFLALTYIGCDVTLVLGVLYTQILLYSFVCGAEVQISADLSIDYAGTIYSIGNCVGSTTGFIVPYVKALMIQQRSRAAWYAYFYLASAITTAGGILFYLLAQTNFTDFSKHTDNDDDNLNSSQIEICSSFKKYDAIGIQQHDKNLEVFSVQVSKDPSGRDRQMHI